VLTWRASFMAMEGFVVPDAFPYRGIGEMAVLGEDA
jgi:hypothetical protein